MLWLTKIVTDRQTDGQTFILIDKQIHTNKKFIQIVKMKCGNIFNKNRRRRQHVVVATFHMILLLKGLVFFLFLSVLIFG